MTKMSGQTLGKMVMGIKVVPVGGTWRPAGWPTDVALKRAGVLWGPVALNWIPVAGALVTGAFMLVNASLAVLGQAFAAVLHDKVAATVVVKTK